MISFCDTIIDNQKHETLEHGTTEFPIGCYFDDLEQNTIPWHWHEELEVGLVGSGNIVISTPNHQCRLSEGECFFINSGILHKIQGQDGKECHIDSFVFHARLVGGTLDSIFWRKFIRPVTSNPDVAMLSFNKAANEKQVHIIKTVWMECANGDYGYEINVQYLLAQLFLFINQEHPEKPSNGSKKMFNYNERVKKMLTYMRAHFHENITVQNIADSVAISESECMRCFRRILETSPIAYLKMYRLQNAAELMNATDWKVSYIAQQCGFSDMSYFSKSFKEIYHCTPSEYRGTHK